MRWAADGLPRRFTRIGNAGGPGDGAAGFYSFGSFGCGINAPGLANPVSLGTARFTSGVAARTLPFAAPCPFAGRTRHGSSRGEPGGTKPNR